MSVPGETPSPSLSRLTHPGLMARTPLRVKLITAMLTLVAIALVVISVAGLGFLKSNLLNQADTELTDLAGHQHGLQLSVEQYLAQGTPSPLITDGTYAIGWIPDGGQYHSVAQEVVSVGVNPAKLGPTTKFKPGPAVTPGARWLSGDTIVTAGAASGNARYRVIALTGQSLLGPNGPATGTIVVGWDVTSVYQTLGNLTRIDLIVSGVLLFGLAVIGIAVIRASLRPLADIEKTAQGIAAGDLSRRVPEHDPHTEVGRLGRSLNTMLAQIETAFRARSASEAAARRSEDRMRQFVADASHELRTPLTAIRGFAEYYRQRGGVELPDNAGGSLSPADLDRIMRRLEQESARMGVLVEDMLLLARLDQQRPLEHRTVDLLTLAADAVHDARVVAPDRAINLTVGAGAALLVLGDEVRLRQVIGNLMSNALAHTPAGTPIDVRIRSGRLDEARAPGTARPELAGTDLATAAGPRSAAVLEVTDHGPGLSREQAEHAFERFYRADQARTSRGTGLGLAIVAALVAAHGGAVWVESAPGAGATFRIALPLAPEAMGGEDHDDSPDAGHDAAAQPPPGPAPPPPPPPPPPAGGPGPSAAPPQPASTARAAASADPV